MVDGGVKGEGKVLDGQGRRRGLINSEGSNPGEGSSSLLVVAGGTAGRKGKHRRFPLRCVISCDIRISTQLLLKSVKGLHAIIST